MVATGISELVMKLVGHSQMALSGMAGLASLQAWLGQELETRGIDAVIYTRYILSILQQDVFIGDDLDSMAENHFFPPNKREGLRAKPVRAGRKMDRRRVVDIADCDQQKKSAAVECLLSLSEEECGIESLVDELYLKLKEQQALINTTEGSSGGTSQSDTAGSSDSDSSEPTTDPAQRYYAAFPALSAEALPAKTTAVPVPPEGGIWAAKVTQGLARIDGSAEVARHTVSPKQVSPLPQTNASEVELGVEKVTDCQYRPGSEWSCRSCGKPGERGRRQRPPRCITCNNWNSHRGRNKDQALKKPDIYQLTPNKPASVSSGSEMKTMLSPSGKLPLKNTKAWKDYEYMRPIFIVPKIHSPDLSTSRVRSVRTNQKTESVLDFFFKSRAALASPLLDQMCYCGAESIWRCTAGCLNWPEMLGLGADSEDQSWYTEPLDVMVKPSPIPSRRLYNRRSVFSRVSNMAFFENLHAFNEAMSDEDAIGLDTLGLSSLLNRTLEDSVQDIEDDESDTDSFNTAEESVAEVVAEEVSFTESQDVFADASSVEPTNDQSDRFCDQDEEESKPVSDEDSDEAAYPPHIKPPVISLPSDDEERMPQNKSPGPQTPEAGSGWESPESQFNWPLSEPITALPMSQSTPESPTPPSIVVESVWDLQPALHSGLINSHLDCLRQNSEAIWGCTSLSPHLEKPAEGLFNVTDNDTTWGFSSSSGSNSHTVSHASSQDNLYDGTGEHGLIDDKCLCSRSAAPVLGGFGLGSRVWESASTSPGPIMGHEPTPISSENEVLDDRPFFYLSLGDDVYEDNEEDGPDSPLPIPPLEFNFSDSDEDEDATSSPASASHPASHHQSPTQTHSHSSSPCVQHSYHPHSCSSSRHHLNIWNGQLGADAAVEDSTQSQSREVCEGSDRGIMASLTCDTLESNSNMSPRGTLSHDILLTTMFPDKSSIWSYCMGSFLSPNPGSDQSLFVTPYEEEWPTGELLGMWPLSPKHQGSDLSHLWDVNAVQRCNFCEFGSEELAVGGETQNIRRYLMNLRFEVPGQECAFINSGLYGSLLTSGTRSEGRAKSPLTPIWSHNPSPQEDGPHTPTIYDYTPTVPIEEHHISERVQLWRNFEMKPQFFRQRSTSADHTDTDDVGLSPSRSTGLLPSENSAFCDQIPPRVTQLPHVQSEPALDRQHATHGRVYNHGRLVQVRSLYKSDTSILHQLGLTCGREDDPQTGVEVLPHTHFLPIKNDINSELGPKTKADANNIERVPTPTGPVPEVCPVLGRQSTYQLYHHPDDDEDMANFIPRFQVQKSTEKCCQTGEKLPLCTPEVDASASSSSTPTSTPTSTSTSEQSAETELDGADVSNSVADEQIEERQEDMPKRQDPVTAETDKPTVCEGGDAQQEALGMFLYDMQDVLELSVEDAERFMSTADTPPFPAVEDKDEVDYSSDYESMGEQVSIEELGRAGIAELWEGGPAGDAALPSSDTPVLGAEGQVASGVGGAIHGSGGANIGVHSYRSIWSWGNDGDLPSLPNSFSSSVNEACDSFPPPVQWSQGDVDVSFTDAGLADVSVGSIGEEKADAGRTSARFTLDPRWADDSDDVFIDDPDVQMQLAGVDPNPEPDQVIFSSDLEQHWLNTRSSFTVQVPNPGQLRHSGQRKPCSFFMEGNCRRTDCKFAHDISNITCRFWEESTCFKGVTCPFLHGYPRAENRGSKRSSSERDFTLEQEEFPELPSQQDEDQTAARETNPISRRRNGMRKLDDRVRIMASGDVERRRRRYKVSSSAPCHGVKHTTSKSISKDGQDKKEESMLSTDV